MRWFVLRMVRWFALLMVKDTSADQTLYTLSPVVPPTPATCLMTPHHPPPPRLDLTDTRVETSLTRLSCQKQPPPAATATNGNASMVHKLANGGVRLVEAQATTVRLRTCSRLGLGAFSGG